MNPSNSVQLSMNFEIAPGVIFQDIQGDVVVLNIGTQQYYGLSSVGADAWNLLLEHGKLQKVASCLEERYQVNPQTVREDLLALVSELVDTGLLKPAVGN